MGHPVALLPDFYVQNFVLSKLSFEHFCTFEKYDVEFRLEERIDWQHAFGRSILQPRSKKMNAYLYFTVFSSSAIIGYSTGMDNLNHHNYSLQYKSALYVRACICM